MASDAVARTGGVSSSIAHALGLSLGGANPPAQQRRAYLEEQHLLLAGEGHGRPLAKPLTED